MIAVGRPAAETDFGLTDSSTCSGTQECFRVGNPSRAMVGSNAGTFYAQKYNASGSSGFCIVFLYQDSNGWHYLNAGCQVSSGGYIPGPMDRVFVTSCANLRDAPGLSSNVIGCLGNGTVVDVDSAPFYLDGHIWWHLAGRGWLAHDFLVAPKNCHC